jgi:hypothetical protein
MAFAMNSARSFSPTSPATSSWDDNTVSWSDLDVDEILNHLDNVKEHSREKEDVGVVSPPTLGEFLKKKR